jgi:signal peptidase I
VTVVLVLFIITFALQAFAIPSGSMENTLLIGDHVFVDRVSLAPRTHWLPVEPYREVRRGDIVVFYKPGEPDLHLVKRVVATPGDRLRLRNGVLYVNGKAQTEPFAIHSAGDYNPYRDEFPGVPPSSFDPVTPGWRAELGGHIQNGDLVVPSGSYFGMGDNRDVSLDSRYWGFIPRENIIGTPLFIYWSYATTASDYAEQGIAQRVGSTVHAALHFFGSTRWPRMLHIVR